MRPTAVGHYYMGATYVLAGTGGSGGHCQKYKFVACQAILLYVVSTPSIPPHADHDRNDYGIMMAIGSAKQSWKGSDPEWKVTVVPV